MPQPQSHSQRAVAIPRRQSIRSAKALRLLIALSLLSTCVVALSGTAPHSAAVAQELIPPPEIWSENAIVISDYNEVLFDQNAHRRTAMASTTKIMTAIVAARYGDIDQEVLIDQSDIVGEASMGLIAGTSVSLRGLLYGLLLPSGNDAAHAIARSMGWRPDTTTNEQAVQNFVDMMNQTAREYQLRDTHFMNPHGLDDYGHYSTPFDLAIMLRAALNYPIIREVMQTPAINVDGYEIWNHNRLYSMRDGVLGGKTGYTEAAGFCLASAAFRDGRFVIAVVTRDDGENWYYDVDNLLDWGLETALQRGAPTWANPTYAGTQMNQQPGPMTMGGP